MANWAKMQMHHGKLGAAMKAKNHQLAMHHAGHIMAAARASDAGAAAPDQEGGEAILPQSMPRTAPSGLRGRLAAMKSTMPQNV